MRARLALLGGVAVALLALPGATHGGSYFPPQGDALPVWSPDGSKIAFLTGRGGPGLAVVAADGSSETRLLEGIGMSGAYPDATGVALSPDWQWAAVTRFDRGVLLLAAVRLDGSIRQDLALTAFGTRPAWSPDSRRLAFRMHDGTLAAQAIDGSDFVPLAAGGASPAWSPDGTRIAYVGGTPGDLDIHVVGADGQGDALVAGGPGAQLEPKWSPDGTRIAFLTQTAVAEPISLAVARAAGSDLRTYPGPGVSNSDAFTWTPDGRALVYARNATQGLFSLELETGKQTRLTSFGGTPAVSPDGLRVAFAAGGECRDRYGIHVVDAGGRQVRRLTHSCRITGTPRDDVLRGTGLADVLVGLGGDDRLLAKDPGYMGDTLLGGDGDDLLIGSYQSDVLHGGPGRDRLLGGKSADVLEGGPGRDWIDGQRGRDLLYARDGSRDTVTCGTNFRQSTPERDEAWVDRLDVVSADCEVVHRAR